MGKVTGIGGVFFKCSDPKNITEWYHRHLGLNTNPYGASFEWYEGFDNTRKAQTQWTPFDHSTNYFEPSSKEFMINYRVDDLEGLVEALRTAGVTILDGIESYDYGKFVHVLDPEGNKIELWEPAPPEEKLTTAAPTPFAQTFFHGTKADLAIGAHLEIGMNSNYGQNNQAKYIYLSATLDAAIWGAELSLGEGRQRIYLVEATGPVENDPNLTDKKFPGNPTMSYRSKHPCRIVGELASWQGHSAGQVNAMKEGLARLKDQGIEATED